MHKNLIAVGLALTLTACQTTVPLDQAPNKAAETGPDTEATPEALNYYVMVRPADTNLIAAADDGKDMFFEFSLVVPAAMQVFDLDGKKLEYGRSHNLLAVSGLHRGVLLRIGKAATFVSIRPDAVKPEPAAFLPSPELAAVRDQLERNTPWYQAMEQAIAKSETNNDSSAFESTTDITTTTDPSPGLAPEVAAPPRPRLLNKAKPSSR